MGYLFLMKAAFSSSVRFAIRTGWSKPPAALPLVQDPPPAPPKKNHETIPAAMWMRPHSTKQMEARMAAMSLNKQHKIVWATVRTSRHAN